MLVPVTLADTLLRVAERGLYRPLWSTRIIGEATDAILEIHTDMPSAAAYRRFEAMNAAFEDAMVEGWEHLESSIALPDSDDRHVVAAALRGRADAIVTANIRDFPAFVMDTLGVAVVAPDDFLLDQLDLAPKIVIDALREQAAHTRRPPLTPTDLLARLARAGVPAFADEVSRRI